MKEKHTITGGTKCLNIPDSYQEKLCERGFLITNERLKENVPAFMSTWNKSEIFGFYFYTHPRQNLYFQYNGDKAYFLIGHAYNPFTGSLNEPDILNEWMRADNQGRSEELEYINSMTGVYIMGKISNQAISAILDCAGMMGGYYGVIGQFVFITSHTVLSAEIFGLQKTKYVQDLLSYKFYSLYGGFLPGDISPYENVYRIVPNTTVKIDCGNFKVQVDRFFPNSYLKEIKDEEDYKKHIEQIATVFRNTMQLIGKKWKKPAISLTGGMDSKTTLAAAKSCYDMFTYFSYITSNAERLDANAAKEICAALEINHKVYEISPLPEDCSDFEITKGILEYNKDYLESVNTNDICKRSFFNSVSDFDVEVKSWVSEIARANYYKKFGKKRMPAHITPRRCSSMYKIFLHNRKLLHETDVVFEKYIEKTKLIENLYNFDWSDLFLWEIRYGSWGGLVITSEHKYSFDITVPYNNRKLLEMMLAVPLEKRRKDILHNDLIKHMNFDIHKTGINIVNLNETKFREFCEKCYFNLNTFLPF